MPIGSEFIPTIEAIRQLNEQEKAALLNQDSASEEQSKFQPVRPQNQKYEVKPTSSGYAPVEIAEFNPISARDLLKKDFGDLYFPVNNFLHQGFSIISAPSKYGKSWFVMWLCICVAKGDVFLGFKTAKCDVLYLALEDSYRRAQSRLRKLLNKEEAPDGLFFEITSRTIDEGFEAQINEWLKKRPQTRLIIIDVLQRVRSKGGRGQKNAYEYDSEELTKIKSIADKHNICILAVHHMTKWKDPSDPFNSFSGSAGMQSVVDQGFAFVREERTSQDTTLHTMGRELPSEQYVIKFDKTTCKWVVVGTAEEEAAKREFNEYNNDPVIKAIRGMMQDNPLGFNTRASEFSINMIPYAKTTVHEKEVGVRFRKYAYFLYKHDRIKYEPPQYSKQKIHKFTYADKYQISFLTDGKDQQVHSTE